MRPGVFGAPTATAAAMKSSGTTWSSIRLNPVASHQANDWSLLAGGDQVGPPIAARSSAKIASQGQVERHDRHPRMQRTAATTDGPKTYGLASQWLP